MRLPDLDLRLFVPRPPFWLVAVLLLSLIGSWVPLALIARQRTIKHDKPRVHIFQDMDDQAKLKEQQASPVFVDGRAMRPRIEGTVARGELNLADHFYRGYELTDDGVTYFDGYPPRVRVDQTLVDTGQVRYNTFCAPCHGEDGYGKGTVQLRAEALIADTRAISGTAWTMAADLHSATFQQQAYPDGKLFNTISNGKGAMNGYAEQITHEDRWAIVAYVRALQLSQNIPADTLTPQQRQRLDAAPAQRDEPDAPENTDQPADG